MFQPYERCVGISTDSNWKDITSAPRDGTPIELENCFGIRPTYSLCKWIQGQGGFTSTTNVTVLAMALGCVGVSTKVILLPT